MTTVVDEVLTGLTDHGDRPALESPHGVLSYTALAAEVDALGTRIRRESGAVTGSRVLISSTHTPGTVTAMLACAHTHLTYVPVPDDLPAARLAHIRDAVRPVAHLRADGDAVAVERLDAEPGGYRLPRNAALPALVPLAVLHTSGSTGPPKSVLIAQENLNHFVRWCRAELPLEPGDRVALLSPLHFDLCTHDILHGLGAGATLVVPGETERTSPQAASAFLAARGITTAYMVPTFLERVAQSALRTGGGPARVRRVMFAGERLTASGRELVERAYPEAELHNLYGPIETNVITALRLERGRPHDSSEVGAGLPGVALRVRRADGTLAGAGRGELLAGGSAVNPGYLDAEQNAARFLTADGARWYRTGDEATLRDGAVYLHGRLDSMVKIRGQRVELDEVEATVVRLGSVRAAAVIARPAGDSIDAFVRPAGDADPAALADEVIGHCRALLPPVAVPGAVHVLPELPVTATGKVDRQALKELRPVAEPAPEVAAAASPVQLIEHYLAEHLGSAPAEIHALRALRDHPRFNSLVAAECIEAVEDHLGRAADYARFTEKSFETIGSMGELFAEHR